MHHISKLHRWRSTIEWSHMSVMARKLLVTRLFVQQLVKASKKSTLHITGLFCCEGDPAVTNGFPQQRTSTVINSVACCGGLSLLKLMSVYWKITVERYNQTPTWGFAMQNFNMQVISSIDTSMIKIGDIHSQEKREHASFTTAPCVMTPITIKPLA